MHNSYEMTPAEAPERLFSLLSVYGKGRGKTRGSSGKPRGNAPKRPEKGKNFKKTAEKRKKHLTLLLLTVKV